MFCKVALICLLGIAATNGRIFGASKYPFYRPQNTNEFYPKAAIPDYNSKDYGDDSKIVRLSLSIAQPSRHLLPPYEDYGGAQMYTNGIFRTELPVWQFRNERPAQDEDVEKLKPQPYPYEVHNRVLPKLEEPTDFQPLETQLRTQEQHINQVVDDVKIVQQSVNGLENYLKGVAAALVPQNKAQNGVIGISLKLTPEFGAVQLDNRFSSIFREDSTEANSSEKEKELDKLISSMFVEDSADSTGSKKVTPKHGEVQLDNFLSRIFGEDSTEANSSEKEKEWDMLISSMFVEEFEDSNGSKKVTPKHGEVQLGNFPSRIFGEDSTEANRSEKELDKLISSMFVEEFADSTGSKKENELGNLISSMIVEDSSDGNSGEKEKEDILFEDDYSETDENSDGKKAFIRPLDYINIMLIGEAQEDKGEKIEVSAAADEQHRVPLDLDMDNYEMEEF